MKILLFSRYDRMGASSRLRSFQYLPFLRKQGIRVDVSPLLDDSYLTDLYSGKKKRKMHIIARYFQRILQLFNSREYDLLWIESELFPWLPAWTEHSLYRSGIPYVVDYDDAIFHRYDMHPNKWVRRFIGRKIDRIMNHATLVIAGNTYLADRAHAAGAKRVEVLPTVVDIDRYPLDTVHTETGTSKSDNRFTIGWIGSPVTAHYLYSVQPALEEIGKKAGACLMTIGAGPVNIKQIRVADLAWSEKTESQFLNRIDVGIMPLPDTPWTRGKCGYKLIQYMACGKPVIASAIGANIDIVDHEKNGLLVSSQKEWITALTRLSEDEQLRKQMGYHGRKKVEHHYCLQITAEKLLYLLESCAGSFSFKYPFKYH